MSEIAGDVSAGARKLGIANRRVLFGFFFLLALVPRLWVLQIALHRDRPVYRYQDSSGYLEAGESLSLGKGYRGREGRPLFWWPPGYPLFLAATFLTGIASPAHPGGALFFQILLASMVVGMSSLIALELGGPSSAWLAGSLMAIEPSSLAFAGTLLSETLFTFLLVLAVVTWVRWWKRPGWGQLVFFACLIGTLPLVRPMALYLWIPLALLIGFLGPVRPRRGWGAPLLFAVVALAPVTAWTIRNYAHLRVPVFAAVSQFNEALFARSVEDLAGVPRPAAATRQPWQEGYGRENRLSFAQVMKDRDEYFLRVMEGHPLLAAERGALTGLGILGVPDDRLPNLLLQEAPQSPERGVIGRLKWLAGLGGIGALLVFGMSVCIAGFLALPILALRCRTWERSRQALLALVAVLVLYHLLVGSTTMYQGDRFRVPIVPLLAVAVSCVLAGRAPRNGEALT
jgi:hypothetical protein